MSNAVIRELAGIDLFAGCSHTTLAYVDRLGTVLDLPAGRVLCAEGGPADEFFVLVRGRAAVQTASGTDAVVHPGGWFGEAGMLYGARRRATVTTCTTVTVMVFGTREFRSLLEAVPRVSERVRESALRVVSGGDPTQAPWYQRVPTRSRPIPVGAF